MTDVSDISNSNLPATDPPKKEAKPYKDTLNLPETSFPMRAGAASREPELQAFWDERDVYGQNMARRKGRPAFVLHDGPPYLSSDKIHIGTALNKILKDIVTRYKTLRGFYSPFVPGYDGHGLPIEAAVEKTIKGGRKAVTALELRQQCRAFALGNVTGQEANFRRLGVWGNWAQPYITIDGTFEATQIELFAQLFAKGYVYKGLKPVHWCPVSESAMAEAEIDYADHQSHSLYVTFPVASSKKRFGQEFDKGLNGEQAELLQNARFAVWTTTPWTLPANVALAVNKTIAYQVLQVEGHGKLIVAEALAESLLTLLETSAIELGRLTGAELEGLEAQHPFLGRTGPVLCGDFVTTEQGTGVVHIAGGHGPDDFFLVQQANRTLLKEQPLPILSPVDGRGHFTQDDTVPEAVQGMFYEKANPVLVELLKEKQALLHVSKFTHSFPHSWRSHAPVIFRATEQWFINVDSFRPQSLAAIDTVDWIPARGKTRIGSMVQNRAEWCISRQRVWGVPIPAFYCKNCGQVHLSPQSTALVAQLFRKETSDAWAQYSADEILNGQISCEACGHTHFNKEEDVMDVWFDSGVTHTAVVEARKDELGELPVSLYLEGSDQHRGWFQSSLLTSVMLRDKAPYQAVLTHGFVLDENGRKMSKSLGNVIDPNTVMKEYGADILRLWVASVDYSSDVRIGQNTLKQLADIYRKVRNTCRFMLSNLGGFNPQTDAVPYEQLSELDRYVLHRLQTVVNTLADAFDRYEFHRFYQVLQNFSVVELSSLYFDVVKDILYCNAPTHSTRLGVQTVLYEVLSALSRVLIPVMPHLAEDIWSHWPVEQRPNFGQEAPPESLLLSDWPELPAQWTLEPETLNHFEALLSLRETVNSVLEEARNAEQIGSALEATIILQPLSTENESAWSFLHQQNPEALATLFLTSQVKVLGEPDLRAVEATYTVLAHEELYEEGEPALRVVAIRAEGQKCARCWQYHPEVGQLPAVGGSIESDLCYRCHHAVSSR